MHFYETPEQLESANLVQLYVTSCAIINLMQDLHLSSALASSSTLYMFHGLMVAATNLLRLLRGQLLTQSPEEFEKSETTFLVVVNLMKKMSVANDDIPGRCSDLLSKLWTSQRVFRRLNGTATPELRIRTRLALSPLVDCLWWYREEFKGHINMFIAPQHGSRPAQSQKSNPPYSNVPQLIKPCRQFPKPPTFF